MPRLRIALLAANPPRRQVGEWVLELKKAIDTKRVGGARYFGLPPSTMSWRAGTMICLAAEPSVPA